MIKTSDHEQDGVERILVFNKGEMVTILKVKTKKVNRVNSFGFYLIH